MKTSRELQQLVLDELLWEPSLDEGQIGVSVTDAVVTLTGHVRSYTEKRVAEKAAKRVAGVQAVANDLTVRLPTDAVRDDTDIAQAAVNALHWHTSVPRDRVRVTVEDGWLTLEGEVDWYFQKQSAYKAVRNLTGLKGVTNLITLKPRLSTGRVRDDIEAALRRSAELDAKRIKVVAEGSEVKLEGNVRSWAEYQDAEWAAWSAPGVTNVDNRLTVKEEPVLLA